MTCEQNGSDCESGQKSPVSAVCAATSSLKASSLFGALFLSGWTINASLLKALFISSLETSNAQNNRNANKLLLEMDRK